MGSAPSNGPGDGLLAAFKIVIAGGFGAGKTTLVGSVSEVRPLRTEESLSSGSIGLDDLGGVDNKTTTTVAMDFGRITISSRLVLYLFGTPGQERFWFMWDELSYGALGAVILADTRRLGDCFPSVDYFEKGGVPFVVAINCFDDSARYDPEDVRVALDLDPRVPVMLCDARQLDSVKQVLITLVEHVLASRPLVLQGRPEAPVPARTGLNVMPAPVATPATPDDMPAPVGVPPSDPLGMPSLPAVPQGDSVGWPSAPAAPQGDPLGRPSPVGMPPADPHGMPPPVGAPQAGPNGFPHPGDPQAGPDEMPSTPSVPQSSRQSWIP